MIFWMKLLFLILYDFNMTIKQNLLNAFLTNEWISNTELSKIAGWRFGGHIHSLKKQWFTFNKKPRNNTDAMYVEYWKLETSPEYKIVWSKIITKIITRKQLSPLEKKVVKLCEAIIKKIKN